MFETFSLQSPYRFLIKKLYRNISILASGPQEIVLSGLGRDPTAFRSYFLRDASQAPSAVDAYSGQKTFSSANVDPDVFPEVARVENDILHITWSDGHEATYSKSWLLRYSSPKNMLKFRRLIGEWVPWKKLEIPQISFNNFMDIDNRNAFHDAVTKLAQYGLLQVKDIPEGEGSPIPYVTQMVERLCGYPKTTFYGTTFDVKSKPQAKNVAYTDVYLPLHMDILYYESPPGIQLLHVIENSTQGGNNFFADSYAAAIHIWKTDPEAYKALCEVPISYHYIKDGKHYFQKRPIIVEHLNVDAKELEDLPPIDHLNYSPPFQAPLDALVNSTTCPETTFKTFLRGLKKFEAFIEDPKHIVEFRMDPQTCIIFQNRRILHARREFDSKSGSRHFKGTYGEYDAFLSTIRTLTV